MSAEKKATVVDNSNYLQIRRVVGGWIIKFCEEKYGSIIGDPEVFTSRESLLKRIQDCIPSR